MYSSKIIRRTVGVAAVAIALVFTTASFAQQPGRIRGQIEKADTGTLSLKQRDGSMLNVKVAEDARVAALVKASLDDIKNDSFIGVAACRGRMAASKRFQFTSSCPRSVASSPIGISIGTRNLEAR
jgi:hypothetical protein